MVTGIEATGVVLALLPLLINQLDNYVQGLETLKSFTAKRYLRELESYLTNLGAQQAIFLNTLGHALKDTLIVDEATIIEAESTEISDSASTCRTCSYHSRSRLNQSDTNVQHAKLSSQLNPSEPKAGEQLDGKGETPISMISDLCCTIFTVNFDEKQRALIGCIADKRYRHHMYHRPAVPWQLAAQYWRARDIMFFEEKFDPTKHPYVVCDIAGEPSMDKNQESSALIRSEVLFSLGLILVELSLCQNLKSLRTQEDADPLEAVANLKTAARYLPVVEMESGLRYGQVVKRCLFGSDAVDTTAQDESMQEKVFEYIIAPLFQNLRDFEELRFHFNSIQIGLWYLPVGIGSLTSRWTVRQILDWNFRREARRQGLAIEKNRQQDIQRFNVEVARLAVTIPLIYCACSCLIAYGWVMEYKTALAGPVVMLSFTGHLTSGDFSSLSLYAYIFEDLLAVPVTKGWKIQKGKSAGALYTSSVEVYIPDAGCSIQAVEDPEKESAGEESKKHLIYVWQNSWSLSSQAIGMMVMSHGDDRGIILPPHMAEIQVIIIPVDLSGVNHDPRKKLYNELHTLQSALSSEGIHAESDLWEGYYTQLEI
ncbi:hypothetical protein CNMCM5793_004856 [Aspergillus hiratsukae]|uniref:DUF7580 domain-containing protein n=1 Tax=Aspergillus hiratsukae TaxID=1194566 RepID=A0A8H6P125_9EURO|nr:hypothetical protein CNMCM5793_004856 [Aspergillus hiratsukae]